MEKGTRKSRETSDAFKILLKGKAQTSYLIENVYVIRRMNTGMVGKKVNQYPCCPLLSSFGFGLLFTPMSGPALFSGLAAAAQGQSVRQHVFCDGCTRAHVSTVANSY